MAPLVLLVDALQRDLALVICAEEFYQKVLSNGPGGFYQTMAEGDLALVICAEGFYQTIAPRVQVERLSYYLHVV